MTVEIHLGNIHNFANRQLCEYASIFPTVESLLDHLFFTIGNGYDFDHATGMIVGDKPIDQYPRMTKKSWDKLIAACVEKEKAFARQYSRGGEDFFDKEWMETRCGKYYPRKVDDSQFTEESLYANIVTRARHLKNSEWGEHFYRPYPICNYSKIYSVNENSPAWFVKIAMNLCKAWDRFLTSEIERGHFSKGTDYSNESWTTKHRDLIREQAVRLQNLLNSKLVPGVKARVAMRDPDWTYAGVAEPTEGLQGVIVEFKESWKHPSNAGKVAIEFNPKDLGYLDDGENEPIIIFFRPQYLEQL
jgi:hypothetical protein